MPFSGSVLRFSQCCRIRQLLQPSLPEAHRHYSMVAATKAIRLDHLIGWWQRPSCNVAQKSPRDNGGSLEVKPDEV